MKNKFALTRLLYFSLILASGNSCQRVDWEWRFYLGSPGSSQYAPLDQINRENVHLLEMAWTFSTGDADEQGRSQIQCNPLVIDGVLYATSPRLNAFALDAATGRELWRFDPSEVSGEPSQGVNRGLAVWGESGQRRLFFAAGPFLFGLDPSTGRPIAEFGEGGKVDLRRGLGRDSEVLFVGANTPGVVYQDLLIQGTRVSEGPGPAAPGHIRAYDVRSGEIRWVFRTVPHPGEFGYETWPPDAWKSVGGANGWSGMSLDTERGLVFIPTGSPAFDFWGGNRVGKNLFGNCLLVLDAATGKRIWHFQFVHHDLWDRDLPAPPNLVTVTRGGRSVDAVAQVTKSGHVFLFDRETGEPLFPVEERPVPASDLSGEQVWPTQPFPLKPLPFARQSFREEDVTTISPQARDSVMERFAGVRTGDQFVPPSREGTMIFPGFDGGAEWGGAAFDPETSILYVNANEMPWILTMVDMRERAKRQISVGERVYSVNCAVCHGEAREGNPSQTFPPVLNLSSRYSADEIADLIVHGKGFMPGFAQLSSQEVRALVHFLLDQEGQVPDWAIPESDIPFSHTGYNRFLDPDGYPAVKPPWGTLNAIDLNTGEFLWTSVLGEFPELTARGIPATGTENYGGPVVTAGGLVFIGASKDEKFRAFDKSTGDVLWETELPAGGYATPCTYEVDGRQFVVIASGGGKMGTKSGDSYLAFALPE